MSARVISLQRFATNLLNDWRFNTKMRGAAMCLRLRNRTVGLQCVVTSTSRMIIMLVSHFTVVTSHLPEHYAWRCRNNCSVMKVLFRILDHTLDLSACDILTKRITYAGLYSITCIRLSNCWVVFRRAITH